ncbi:MAG: glycosyltransferase family 4 protein [Verrucomicrobia bacterium]|nr:glycosyltransferase family 4 protein [Verrucomicrobiota bacterium]
MKILLLTHAFHPLVGGLETVAKVLANEFCALGHEVRLVTPTPASSDDDDAQRFGFPVYRQPSAVQLLKLTRWCDIFFQNNISLQTWWPLLILRRPWVVAHQTWLTREQGHRGWQDHLKQMLIIFGSPIAISRAMATSLLPVPTVIIGNPYEASRFRILPDVPRDRQLAFLGRLVSDKGMDLVLDALVLLKKEHRLTPSLTVLGDGPEMPHLRAQCTRLGLDAQVTFAGTVTGDDLVRALNRHRILVVPSRLAEPFGVVALEGAACGCLVVGSSQGGLGDAIGEAGLTFPNNRSDALAKQLARALTDQALVAKLRERAPAHLAQFHPRRVAEAYLEVFARRVKTP